MRRPPIPIVDRALQLRIVCAVVTPVAVERPQAKRLAKVTLLIYFWLKSV